MREATGLAIDRETMVGLVREGLGKPAKQMTPSGFFGANADIPTPADDPATAGALPDEAGHPDRFGIDLLRISGRLPGDGAI